MILLFEDLSVTQLAPLNIGKPTYALSCAAERLVDLARRVLPMTVRAWVRPHLRALEAADYPEVCLQPDELSGEVTLVNARLVPAASQLELVRALAAGSGPCILTAGEVLVAARTAWADRLLVLPVEEWLPLLRTEPQTRELAADGWELFAWPHDVVKYHMRYVAENLNARLQTGYTQTLDGVFLAPQAQLGEHVVVDTSKGPILIDRDATIGPFSLLRGPLYIGAGARINEHAALKDGTCLGHTTKVGGEVECCILEPFSNKQHHGFLGHSYIGSWVNLGAGTSNSDLKNTYGTVNMSYRGRKITTGMQFIGCMIGDYAKTAINTGIFTGKTIGACSMVYGFVTGNVPSFVNYARSFGQVTEAPVDVMINTQARMFSRRGKTQRPCDIELLRKMYELTADERTDFGEPLHAEPLSW